MRNMQFKKVRRPIWDEEKSNISTETQMMRKHTRAFYRTEAHGNGQFISKRG